MDAQSHNALNRRVVEETSRIENARALLDDNPSIGQVTSEQAAEMSVKAKLALVKQAVELRDDTIVALASNPLRGVR